MLIFIVQGVFLKNTVIIGTAVSGRFGICVEGLGDINNDGYEGMYVCMYVFMYVLYIYIDFAVSAPYEGSGVVYIYHGQQMDVNGTIVNTQYQQVRIHVLVNKKFYLYCLAY